MRVDNLQLEHDSNHRHHLSTKGQRICNKQVERLAPSRQVAAAAAAAEQKSETSRRMIANKKADQEANNRTNDNNDHHQRANANSEQQQQQQVPVCCGQTNQSEKNPEKQQSSSDEGLGSTSSSATSSGQSSTAGSHCDDRETPPHLAVIFESCPAGGAEAGLQRDRCDSRMQLSSGGEQESANFNQNGSQKESTSSNGLETNVVQTRTSERVNEHEEVEEEEEEEQQQEPVFFHTDCFNCCTCNELLVDLRALIYVNPSSELEANSGESKQDNCCNLASSVASPSQAKGCDMEPQNSEYVNLPNEQIGGPSAGRAQQARELQQEKPKQVVQGQANGGCSGGGNLSKTVREQEQEAAASKSKLQAQISLYCHRHFVELFKPRCQQCDCLILDEECTEAEGK